MTNRRVVWLLVLAVAVVGVAILATVPQFANPREAAQLAAAREGSQRGLRGAA